MDSPQAIADTLNALIRDLKGGIIYGSFGLSVGDKTVIPRLQSLVPRIAALQVPQEAGGQKSASGAFPIHTLSLLNAKGLAVPPRGMQDMDSPLEPLDFGLYNSLPARYLEGRVKISTIGTLLEAVGAGLQARARKPQGSIRSKIPRLVYDKQDKTIGPQDTDEFTRIALLNSQFQINGMGGITEIYLKEDGCCNLGKANPEEPCVYWTAKEYRHVRANTPRPRAVCIINTMPISFQTFEVNSNDVAWQTDIIRGYSEVIDPNFKYYVVGSICFGADVVPNEMGYANGKIHSALHLDQHLYWRIPKLPPYKIEWRGHDSYQPYPKTGVLLNPRVLKGGKVLVTMGETRNPTYRTQERGLTLLGPSRRGDLSPLFDTLTRGESPFGTDIIRTGLAVIGAYLSSFGANRKEIEQGPHITEADPQPTLLALKQILFTRNHLGNDLSYFSVMDAAI